MLLGSGDRCIFRLLLEVERLEATFWYEMAAAPPLAITSVDDLHFNVSIYPSTLKVDASLGNVCAQDAILPMVCTHLPHKSAALRNQQCFVLSQPNCDSGNMHLPSCSAS